MVKFNLSKHSACVNGQVAALGERAERIPDMAQKRVLTWFAKSTGARCERREFDDQESTVIFCDGRAFCAEFLGLASLQALRRPLTDVTEALRCLGIDERDSTQIREARKACCPKADVRSEIVIDGSRRRRDPCPVHPSQLTYRRSPNCSSRRQKQKLS